LRIRLALQVLAGRTDSFEDDLDSCDDEAELLLLVESQTIIANRVHVLQRLAVGTDKMVMRFSDIRVIALHSIVNGDNAELLHGDQLPKGVVDRGLTDLV
jgi:hypothetical protein